MRERYEEKLTQLQKKLLDMSMLCEQAIRKMYQLLISSASGELLVEEIDHLEKEINSRAQIGDQGKTLFLRGVMAEKWERFSLFIHIRGCNCILKTIQSLEKLWDEFDHEI